MRFPKFIIALRSASRAFANRLKFGAPAAKEIREAIQKLAPEFRFIAMDKGVETGDIIENQSEVDYRVLYGKRELLYFDVVRSNYSFDGPPRPTGNIPIRWGKVEFAKTVDLPVYVVDDLSLERAEIGERCVWISMKEALLKGKEEWLETNDGRIQHNLSVDKYAWHKGLKSLADDWRKLL